jgi:tRNA(Ile)-lysidine synthase
MASSRKSRRKADPDEAALLDALKSAVEEAAADIGPEAAAQLQSTSRRRSRAAPLVLAFSGGRDSTALIDAAARLQAARSRGFADLLAVHVHHGLLAQADQWVDHCEAVCKTLAMPFEVRHVKVERRSRGTEAAARDARYAALAAVAHERGARCVLTAHHMDDRIETFLIQWLRGAGIEGLAAFPAQRDFGTGAGSLRLVRPFIDISRVQIDRYVALRELRYVEDPSNADTRLLRNVLRARVIPELESARAGFRRAATRSIDLVAEAAHALREVANADLAICTEDAPTGMLWLERLAQLTPQRRALVLRAWLSAQGVEAPSRARLTEIARQAMRGCCCGLATANCGVTAGCCWCAPPTMARAQERRSNGMASRKLWFRPGVACCASFRPTRPASTARGCVRIRWNCAPGPAANASSRIRHDRRRR